MSDEVEEAPEAQPVSENGVVDALLRERAAYERRGLKDRVAEVNVALKAEGYEIPKGRSSKPSETA